MTDSGWVFGFDQADRILDGWLASAVAEGLETTPQLANSIHIKAVSTVGGREGAIGGLAMLLATAIQRLIQQKEAS